jgi:hypothetical protein
VKFEHHGRQAYEFCVRGPLSEVLVRAFPDFKAGVRGADTVLRGSLPDQAALRRVLEEIEVVLELELLEVRRLVPGIQYPPGCRRPRRTTRSGRCRNG